MSDNGLQDYTEQEIQDNNDYQYIISMQEEECLNSKDIQEYLHPSLSEEDYQF